MSAGDSRAYCATLKDGNFVKVDKEGTMITKRAVIEV